MPTRKLRQLRTYARTGIGLRAFLRSSLSPEAAERTVGSALAERQDRLLTLLRERVWDTPTSPYLALLQHAGMTEADVADLVDREGGEGALAHLASHGVYV